MTMLHRYYDVEIRAPKDKDSRAFDFVFSTAAIDSYDEIIEQDWLLERFLRNPVVLWNHNIAARGFLSGPPEAALPIGKASNVKIEANRLVGTITLVSEKANPIAERVYHGLVEGSLNATSVGFTPGNVRYEKRGDRELYVLSQNELHEISIVPVPANPEAVLRSARLEDLRALSLRKSPTDAHRARRSTSSEETPRMDIEKQLAEKSAALLVSEERVKSLDTQLKAYDAQNKTLATERDDARKELAAAEARAKVAEKAAVVTEVRGLVGVKITAAEEESFVKLALTNRELFDEMIKQRSDMQLLTKGSVLSKENALRAATKASAASASRAAATDAESEVEAMNHEAGISA